MKPKILCIPTILIIFFFLSNLVSKHQEIRKLFSSTYELLSIVTKSSRVAVFATFNVIVITLYLRSSSKPPSAACFDDGFFLPSPGVSEVYSEKEKENNEDYDSYEDQDDDDYHGYDGYDEDNDDDLDTEDVDSGDDEKTSIDLEKRTEEFIATVYKKWSEELVAERFLCLETPS